MKFKWTHIFFGIAMVFYIILGVRTAIEPDDPWWAWLGFPFAAMIACMVAAIVFPAKYSWILAVVSCLAEIFLCSHGLDKLIFYTVHFYESPSLWAPIAGYVVGILIYLIYHGIVRSMSKRTQ